MVPSTVEMIVDVTPTIRLFLSPFRISGRSSSLRNQSRVKPVHSTENVEALNENAMRMRRGRCRNSSTAPRTHQPPRHPPVQLVGPSTPDPFDSFDRR